MFSYLVIIALLLYLVSNGFLGRDKQLYLSNEDLLSAIQYTVLKIPKELGRYFIICEYW